jgi:lipopolysaccharide export system permease protein
MINVLYKYLIRETLRYFFMVLILVVVIYLSVDFFEKIGDFMEAGLPFSHVIEFFIFSIPFVISQILPVGILLSVLICFGLMNKHNELTALRSCGISLYTMLKPILTYGVIFTFILFFISEAVVPITMTTANYIWLKEVKKEQAVSTRENNIWMKNQNVIIHIRHYNPKDQTLYKVAVNCFDDQFKLVRRLDADHGSFVDGRWILYEILEQELDESGSYNMLYHESMPVDLDMNPERLKQVAKKTSEMGLFELLHHIHSIEDEGYTATQYRVDFHSKIAFPFVCIILVLAGMGISCRNRLKDGLPASIAYGIGMAFLYWVLNSFCISLGYGEMLPPIIAAWATNVILLCFSLVLLMQVEQL